MSAAGPFYNRYNRATYNTVRMTKLEYIHSIHDVHTIVESHRLSACSGSPFGMKIAYSISQAVAE